MHGVGYVFDLNGSYHDLTKLAIQGLEIAGIIQVYGGKAQKVRLTRFGKNAMDEAMEPHMSIDDKKRSKYLELPEMIQLMAQF